MTGSEIVPISQAVEQALPAVTSLAETAGLLGPPRAVAEWLTQQIGFRTAPSLARTAMSTAEKIKATGMPVHAVSDPTLRKILEGAAAEADPDLRAMWENLLVSEAVEGRQPPRFIELLRGLEPAEARFLNAAVVAQTVGDYQRISDPGLPLTHAQADNLDGMNLISPAVIGGSGATPPPIPDPDDPIDVSMYAVTSLARKFVRACQGRSPGPPF